MADNCIQLIPADPEAVPEKDKADAALKLLKRFFPRADEVTAFTSCRPRFFHPGELLTGSDCPRCGKTSDDWWEGALAAAMTSGDIHITAPCCGAPISLNDLDFDSPAGFARFVLEASNPRSEGLGSEDIADLEAILGLKLRQIHVQF
ncbi:MAG: hypothetical protein U1E50_03075 [Caulobacteraceae bacterium]